MRLAHQLLFKLTIYKEYAHADLRDGYLGMNYMGSCLDVNEKSTTTTSCHYSLLEQPDYYFNNLNYYLDIYTPGGRGIGY